MKLVTLLIHFFFKYIKYIKVIIYGSFTSIKLYVHSTSSTIYYLFYYFFVDVQVRKQQYFFGKRSFCNGDTGQGKQPLPKKFWYIEHNFCGSCPNFRKIHSQTKDIHAFISDRFLLHCTVAFSMVLLF